MLLAQKQSGPMRLLCGVTPYRPLSALAP